MPTGSEAADDGEEPLSGSVPAAPPLRGIGGEVTEVG